MRDLNHLVSANFRYRATPQTELFGNEGFYYVAGLYGRDRTSRTPPSARWATAAIRCSRTTSAWAPHTTSRRACPEPSSRPRASTTPTSSTAPTRSASAPAPARPTSSPSSTSWAAASATPGRASTTPSTGPASDTDYYNLFGSWQWVFDETTSFAIRAGPALIHSNQEDPAGDDPTDRDPVHAEPDGSGDRIRGVRLRHLPDRRRQIRCCSTTPATPVPRGPSRTPGDRGHDHSAGPPLTDLDLPRSGFAAGGRQRHAHHLFRERGHHQALESDPGLEPQLRAPGRHRLGNRWRRHARRRHPGHLLADLGPLGRRRARGLDAARVGDGRGAGVRGSLQLPAPLVADRVTGILFGAAGAENLIQIDSPDSLDTQRWGAAARIAYRLTKNTVTSLQYAYNKQSSNGDTVGVTSDFDDHLLTFTVQYNFEPIGLWW